MLRFIRYLLPVLLIAAAPAVKTGPAISEADLRVRLNIIADDSMGGRPAGSVGHIKVTQYIADEMKRLGLVPAGDNGTYFQNVPFVRREIAQASLNDLKLGDDFIPVYPGGMPKSFDGAQVVFGGPANDTTQQISADQATGKFVILHAASGGGGRGGFRGAGAVSRRFMGAAAVATISSSTTLGFMRQQLTRSNPSYVGDAQPSTRPAAFMIDSAAAQKLLAAGTVHGSVTFKETPLTVRNVIGIIPGSDAKLKGEYVAIGAHNDHLPNRLPAVDHDSLKEYNRQLRLLQIAAGPGMQQVSAEARAQIHVNVDSLHRIRPVRLDSINNGADDDGSGTVALLEIAESMASAKKKPARSIIFVSHTAEELGLNGSQWFTDHPTVPRDSIVTQLNMDMIGRGRAGDEKGGGPDFLQLVGWRRLSNELGNVIDAVNKTEKQVFKFDLTMDANGSPDRIYCRSDHYEYARYGIPIAFFFTGLHGDYHQVTDEVQYIDFTKLRNVAQLVNDIGLKVANMDHRPVVDGPKPDPHGVCVQ